MTVVLGINGVSNLHLRHDPAAALLVNGQIAVAVEEERLARVKRAFGLSPARAVREVLDVAAVRLRDVDLVTYPWSPRALGASDGDIRLMIRTWLGQFGLRKDVEIRFVEHHIAHAWSGIAFIPGGVSGRRVGALALDGSGESTSGACYIYDGQLRRRWNLEQSASLGAYYEAVSEYLGFGAGEEGKTMGLASYGSDSSVELPPLPDRRFAGSLPRRSDDPKLSENSFAALRAHLVAAFRERNGGSPTFNQRANIAFAAERLVGQRVITYAAELLDEVDVLVLSGGLALNCTINAQVAALCDAKGVALVIPPPASDTGVAVGSVLAGADSPLSVAPIVDPFLGRPFEPDLIARELHEHGVSVDPLEAKDLASELLERSVVCGWFEGRSEVGPRALGKRSIIARADSPTIRDRINALKGREAWRPLAPSLTAREFDRSFPESTPSPHMLIKAQVSPAAHDRLQGVIHVDGSSRPQVVSTPGPYHDLLVEVGQASGTEAIICTSFNRAGEPIVYTPHDALTTARAMGLDLLAGDGWCARLTPGT